MSYEEHRYTSHDGLSLYYRAYGTGPETVICLPGLTRNSKDFERLAEHLCDRWRVLTPDLRGRGRSDRDPKWKQYRPATYVRDIWTLMDAAGVERVAVVGTSLGGLMAMIMADQQPERLLGVVMNDIGPEVARVAIARILEYTGRTPAQPGWTGAAEVTRQNYEIAYPGEDAAFWERQARLAWREVSEGQVVPDYDSAIGDALRRTARSAGLIRMLQKLGVRRLRGVNLNPWDSFRCMNMPTLLVKGEISDIVAAGTIDRMRAIKPDLEVAVVPNRGHAPTLDEPEARAAIDSFLEGLPIGHNRPMRETISDHQPHDVLGFWFGECSARDWFRKDPVLDATIKRRYSGHFDAALSGRLDLWKGDAHGCLAWIIVLDQFSRNMFRGQARAFAQDGLALAATQDALERGLEHELRGAHRTFLVMPLMHSEELPDQERCVELFEAWGWRYRRNLKYAIAHRDVIARFGRFPHRNEALGRESTPAEREFLATHKGF